MYGQIPSDTLAELLLYLNDHESFDSLKTLGTVSRQALSASLKALAKKLKDENPERIEAVDFRNWKELTEPYREILAKLSPREVELLMKGLNN